MIVRAILTNPEIASNFDFFNDFKNTENWLMRLPESPERNEALDRLRVEYAKWLKREGYP